MSRVCRETAIFRLDKESRKAILDNLKAQFQVSRARMLAELCALAAQLQRRPTLIEFLAETRYELPDIYESSIGGWYSLLHEAQFLTEPLTETDLTLTKRFQLFLHIDSIRRLRFYKEQLGGAEVNLDTLPQLERRMVEMLTFRLLQGEARQPGIGWEVGLARLQQNGQAKAEFAELCDALIDRVRLHADERSLLENCPLFLHRQFIRDEIIVALGFPQRVGSFPAQSGVFWIKELNTEAFFVTLDKSERTFSPSNRYEDYALSPTRFHWQSQSTTSENSPTGTRYITQRENGAMFLLFVRPRKTDAFLFLGPLQYVSHSGSRPMSIHWNLQFPMPAWFFKICASLRAA